MPESIDPLTRGDFLLAERHEWRDKEHVIYLAMKVDAGFLIPLTRHRRMFMREIDEF